MGFTNDEESTAEMQMLQASAKSLSGLPSTPMQSHCTFDRIVSNKTSEAISAPGKPGFNDESVAEEQHANGPPPLANSPSPNSCLDVLTTTVSAISEFSDGSEGNRSAEMDQKCDASPPARGRDRSASPFQHFWRRSASSGRVGAPLTCGRLSPLQPRGKSHAWKCSSTGSPSAGESAASPANHGPRIASSIRKSPYFCRPAHSRASQPSCSPCAPSTAAQGVVVLTSPSDSRNPCPRNRLGLEPATMWCSRGVAFEGMRLGESINTFLARKKGYLVDLNDKPKPMPKGRMASDSYCPQPAAPVRPKQVSRA
uniref:Uncharacterized protein n=1 Tax=Chrysotila carterae TaxID=13221 RepID=A0A7S4B3U7_CHRCT